PWGGSTGPGGKNSRAGWSVRPAGGRARSGVAKGRAGQRTKRRARDARARAGSNAPPARARARFVARPARGPPCALPPASIARHGPAMRTKSIGRGREMTLSGWPDESEILHLARRSDRCTVLGPGTRAVLWVQGCPLRCPGCVAPETLPFAGGTAVRTDSLA